MAVRLAWRGDNAAIADNIIIYRATSPIPADNLPTPLNTLAGSAVSYDDNTVVRGTTYYYRIAAVKGSDVMLTENQIHAYFPDSGPGPQKIIRGDWKRGYFGRIAVSDFLSVTEARALCGVTTGAAQSDANLTHWYKFIYDGKILFMPCATLTTSLSWKNIYDYGLMHGTDDNGAIPAGAASGPYATNQKKIVTAKGYNFLVRQPKASTLPTGSLITSAQLADCEWLETIARTSLTFGRADARARWDDQAASSIVSCVTAHWTTTSAAVTFGGNPNDTDSVINPGSASPTYGWLPVFELQY